ncbi:hypothetical protein NRA54_14990 [Acinetobacter baumannii]|nr:hypothetical protein [Acinetobacter baumannii]
MKKIMCSVLFMCLGAAFSGCSQQKEPTKMKNEKIKDAHEQCMYEADIVSLAAMARQVDIPKEYWFERETKGKDDNEKEIYKTLGDKAYALPQYEDANVGSRAVSELTEEVYNSCMDKKAALTKRNFNEEAHEQCMYAKNIASLAASARQVGMSKEDWLKKETAGKSDTMKEIYKILADKAYALPQYEDASSSSKPIKKFTNEIYNSCMEKDIDK